jgi:uncharacterized protein (TIGR02001 family)
MYRLCNLLKRSALYLFSLIFTVPIYADVEFAGNLTAVSTYVWRGIKANSGPAVQTEASFTHGIVTLGVWGSSLNFNDDVEVETDPYGNVVLTDGDFSSSLGFTVYMFDFRTFNDRADAELELNAMMGYGPVGMNIFYVPSQNSTKGDLVESLYWLELSAGETWMGADLSAGISYGTYSSRWMLNGPTKDPVGLLLLTAGKSLSDEFSVFWTYSLDLFNSDFENIFYFGGSYSF